MQLLSQSVKLKCHVAGALRLPRSVIAIGTFDGVHRGHQKVLGNAVNAARRLNCPAVVYTFDLPPKALFKGTSVLTAPDEKVRRLAALGLDHCILAKFDRTYASRTAEAFLSELAALNPAEIWVGEDFRFGADRKGDVATLAAHFPVRLTNAVRCHDGDVISSTRIRTLMEEGDTLAAEILVGHFSDCHDATELWRVT